MRLSATNNNGAGTAPPIITIAATGVSPIITERPLTTTSIIEFLNLILGTQVTVDEKTDLEAFLRAL